MTRCPRCGSYDCCWYHDMSEVADREKRMRMALERIAYTASEDNLENIVTTAKEALEDGDGL